MPATAAAFGCRMLGVGFRHIGLRHVQSPLVCRRGELNVLISTHADAVCGYWHRAVFCARSALLHQMPRVRCSKSRRPSSERVPRVQPADRPLPMIAWPRRTYRWTGPSWRDEIRGCARQVRVGCCVDVHRARNSSSRTSLLTLRPSSAAGTSECICGQFGFAHTDVIAGQRHGVLALGELNLEHHQAAA